MTTTTQLPNYDLNYHDGQIQPRHNAVWAYKVRLPSHLILCSQLMSQSVPRRGFFPQRVVFYSMGNPSRLPRRRPMTATHHDNVTRSATTLLTTILTHWQPLPPSDDDNDSSNPNNERRWFSAPTSTTLSLFLSGLLRSSPPFHRSNETVVFCAHHYHHSISRVGFQTHT